MRIINVDFDVTGLILEKKWKHNEAVHQLFIDFKKWEYNEALHQLFIDFKNVYDSVRRGVLYNILIASVIT